MATEIAPGVYDFPQTFDGEEAERTFHPSAVETPRGLLLVDVGLAGLTDQLGSNLEAVGADWADVWAVVLTHQDGDHAGALADVLDRTDAAVFAHERCAPYVDGRESPIKSEGERYPPADVDVTFVDDVTFRTDAGPMAVVATPGHSPGHVSLYLPEASLLLAGDALTVAGGALQGPNEQFTLDMDEALESARRLATLEFDRTLCHHGGFAEAGTTRVREVVDGST